jgi:AcrR family transcriptional regulator
MVDGDGRSGDMLADRGPPTSERILDGAGTLFARDGVRATPVSAIIAEAGIAKATLYRHFASKDELVAAWIERRGSRWLDALADEVSATARSPALRLTRFFDAVIARMSDPETSGAPFIDLALELRAPDAAVQRALVGTFTRIEELLAGFAADAGAGNPRAVGEQLALLLFGALVAARILPGRSTQAGVSARAAARRLVRPASAP